MIYYARSPRNGLPAQTYEDHVHGVRERAMCYANAVQQHARQDGEPLLACVEQAATYHDVGKLDTDNQGVLSGRVKNKKKHLPVNHVDAGVAFLSQTAHHSPSAVILVSSHHTGLPDIPNELIKQNHDLCFRDTNIVAKVNQTLPELIALHNALISAPRHQSADNPKGNIGVFLRIALSCLVDGDHTDAAMHTGEYPQNEPAVSLLPAERLAQLDAYVAQRSASRAEDPRTPLRNAMYRACRSAEVSAGIVSCDSPVGTGKTTAVMAHLLAQAQRRGLRRIFVVLPFTNIIEQSVKTYREALVLPGENPEAVVAELHHRAEFDDPDTRKLTALWHAPIVVTTAVAFFETLAACAPATLRRIHELPGSAIFMDEAHAALPTHLLPLAWQWMRCYAEEWGCYWLLASGSLFRFWSVPEIVDKSQTLSVPELIDDPLRQTLSTYETQRVCHGYEPEPKNTQELASWILGFEGPRLVILNTVQSAAALADHIATQYGRQRVEHLSTSLLSTDRAKTLQRIKDRLDDQNDRDWTLVATSCVEAGVDFSFRNGFREIASLVSLLQSMGRVDREGLYGNAQMWSFTIREDSLLKRHPGLKTSADVLREHLENSKTIIPDHSTASIHTVLKLEGIDPCAAELMDDERDRRFPAVADGFKVIDADARLVVIDAEIAKKVQHGKLDWLALQKASVRISGYKLAKLKIPMLKEGIYHWNLAYDDFLGYMAGILAHERIAHDVLIL